MIRPIGPISLGLGDPMSNAAQLRRNMVDTQLRTYDVTSLPLLDAVESVDRELFVPAALRNLAYIDQVVTLGGEGGGRRLLTPMVLARLLQAADIHKGDRVLDVAGGTGYGAAIMRALGAEVTMLEANEGLAAQARSALAAAGISGVDVSSGALAKGLAKEAPFDVIIVNGAIETSPNALFEQLADGGRLVAVVGSGRSGRVTVFRKDGQTIGQKAAFDAAADLLSEFAPRPGFVF
jgi:protein-L-isoaspartate(D-aspartate) O-methyltransferase